jgi:hypothetical protein
MKDNTIHLLSETWKQQLTKSQLIERDVANFYCEQWFVFQPSDAM